jgi:hypothetical protein
MLAARMLLLAALCLLVACGGAPARPSGSPGSGEDLSITVAPRPTEDVSQCPRLDAKLRELAGLPDPTARAAELGVTIEAGRAFVSLGLRDESPASLAAYGAEITTQVGSRAQGFVPLDQLCALANDAAVTAVEIPVMLRP